ncbi:MAG: hypothetical protein U0821_21930 [Chloroflexota bacterium]
MVRRFLFAAVLLGALALALMPGQQQAEAQNCYGTGFCINNQAFLGYYNGRGQEKSLGFPISNEFTLEGFQVQIFQRVVLQLNQGNVARLNLLDQGIMPLTRANASVFPGPDPALASQAPAVGSGNYASAMVEFVRQVSPNSFNNLPVGFFNKFMETVPPQPGANNDIMTLLNLEIWGAPTSRPVADPGNGGFIYQRYQRGIMHYQDSCKCTEGILIGEYFKSILTGVNLPGDLEADMRSTRYYRQYDPAAGNAVARPDQLQNTNLTNAFGNISVPAQPRGTPPPAATTAPAGTATATATTTAAGPQVNIQINDSRIDPGQKIEVTVIANSADGLDWIQWEGLTESKVNENDNKDKDQDPELARKEFDCDKRPACANVWTVAPTKPGEYILRARARDLKQNRSEWVTTSLRVRSGPTPTATVTTTPAPGVTGTPTATPIPPVPAPR